MPLFCRFEDSILPIKFVTLFCKGGYAQVVVVVEAGDGARQSSHQGELVVLMPRLKVLGSWQYTLALSPGGDDNHCRIDGGDKWKRR